MRKVGKYAEPAS